MNDKEQIDLIRTELSETLDILTAARKEIERLTGDTPNMTEADLLSSGVTIHSFLVVKFKLANVTTERDVANKEIERLIVVQGGLTTAVHDDAIKLTDTKV